MKRILLFLLILTSTPLFSQKVETTDTNPQIELQTGHNQYITCSVFSSDGKLILTGGADNKIILWDVQTGKQIRTISHHSDEIVTLNLNSDNTKLISTSKDNSIAVTELISGQLLHKFTFQNHEISNAYFTQSENSIVAITNRDKYFIFNARTYDKEFEGNKDYGDYTGKGLVSPEGFKALIKINWKKIACIDIRTKDTLFTSEIDKAYQMQFTPDGKHIVVSSSKLFSKIFDSESGKEVATLESKPELKCDGCNTKFAISPNGKYLFTKSSKNDGAIWNIPSGKKIASLDLPEDRPYQMMFTNDSKQVIVTFGKELYLISNAGKINWKTENKWINYYKFYTANNNIALPSENNTGTIYSLTNFKKKIILQGFFNQSENSGLKFEQTNYYDKAIINYLSYKCNVSITPENSAFLIGKTDTSAQFIDIQTGKTTYKIYDSKVILTHCFSSDGELLAIAGGNKEISIYDARNFKKLIDLKGHQELIFDLSFSNDNKHLLSGSWDGTMIIWDMHTFLPEKRIDLGNISPYTVCFDANDIYAISGDLGENINYFEIDTKKSFRTLIGHTSAISDIAFKPDGSKVVSVSWDNTIKIWDANTGMQIHKTKLTETPIYSVCVDEKSIFTGDASQTIKIWSWDMNKVQILQGHSAAVTDIQLSTDQKWIISRAANGEVIVWDYQTQKMKYKYIQINENDWISLNENGYFDGSPKAIKKINYVVGNKVIAVNSLFDKYYTPSLISRVMNGEDFESTGMNINTIIDEKPEIDVQIVSTQSRNISPLIDNTYEADKETLELAITPKQKDIDEIRVYNNGKLQTNDIFKKEISFRGSNNNFAVQLADGINNINVIAIKEGIESEPIHIKVNYSSKLTHSNLYILTIGINKYKNSSYNLDFAEKDADEFAKTISKGADTLFDQIKKTELKNENATKANIKQAIAKITEEITPNDVFVFYYAGHGVMSLAPDEKFYIATHALTNFYNNDMLIKEGVSANELVEFSKNISAQKQLFILDACHSGGALNALSVRGANREKAIAQLARTTGTYFLTAAEDAQYANESGNLKHGLFTYAILEILQGKNQVANSDGVISVNEIKTYIENRVPELSEEVHGTPQFPTSYSFGHDFPIVILK